MTAFGPPCRYSSAVEASSQTSLLVVVADAVVAVVVVVAQLTAKSVYQAAMFVA
jgi:hypothetical protein